MSPRWGFSLYGSSLPGNMTRNVRGQGDESETRCGGNERHRMLPPLSRRIGP
jgi:hypothetical protein